MIFRESILAALIAGAALAPAHAAVLAIGDPNFYGRIEFSSGPPPAVQNVQPVYGARPLAGATPVYLRVPEYQRQDWPRFCLQYYACDRPVYLVHEEWYARQYGLPYYSSGSTPPPPPAYAYRRRPEERLYEVPVSSVHAVVGPPSQRCWMERQDVVVRDRPNTGGAIAGAVIGGILGHQIGSGRGNDAATVGGAVAGGAIGANAGRDSHYESRDVQRCETAAAAPPEFWDVSYFYRGVEHHVQMSSPPGATIAVNGYGEPRM